MPRCGRSGPRASPSSFMYSSKPWLSTRRHLPSICFSVAMVGAGEDKRHSRSDASSVLYGSRRSRGFIKPPGRAAPSSQWEARPLPRPAPPSHAPSRPSGFAHRVGRCEPAPPARDGRAPPALLRAGTRPVRTTPSRAPAPAGSGDASKRRGQPPGETRACGSPARRLGRLAAAVSSC
jgi:hypothetical protein